MGLREKKRGKKKERKEKKKEESVMEKEQKRVERARQTKRKKVRLASTLHYVSNIIDSPLSHNYGSQSTSGLNLALILLI